MNFIDNNGKKTDWNQFLIENNGNFLQSFEWGEFQKEVSKKIWRIEIKKEDDILAEAQTIKEPFPLKSFLYIPFGPVFKKDLSLKRKKEILGLILKKEHQLAKKKRAFFLKIEPFTALPEPVPRDFGFRDPLKRIQPQKTLILELRKPEEEIFKNFHPKTRYNIKLAERKKVRILLMTNESKTIREFYKLVQKTSKRNKLHPYPEEYYRKMLEIKGKDLKSELFLAKYKNKVIAGNIIIFFGQRATYLHGASDYKYRALMAPHFLQWRQIMEAKKRGCKEYDFWGIDETRWPGLTRFKKSFGGREIEYPSGRDIIFQNNWYRIYKIIRKTRKPV